MITILINIVNKDDFLCSSVSLNFPGDVSAMALCAGLQRSPTIQDTLFQAYLFSVKPGCYRVTPYAHCPYRADIGREEWTLFCYGRLAPEGKKPHVRRSFF